MHKSPRSNMIRLPAAVLIVVAGGCLLWQMSQRDAHDAVRPSGSETATAEQGPAHPAVAANDDRFPQKAARPGQLIDSIIRVNLTPVPRASLRLEIDGRYRVRLLQPEAKSVAAPPLPAAEVRIAGDAIQIGKRKFRAASLEIVPEKSPSIWVNDHQYRGVLRLHRQEGGKLIAVNLLPLHHYLASVVDSEMPAAFPRAAREAQCIVARTYALYQMAATADHPWFNVYSTTRSQNYLGFQYRTAEGRRLAGESSESRDIVRATAGRVCTRRGKLVPTYYSAVCGGRTTDGGDVFRDAGLIRSARCNWCRAADLYRWKSQVDRNTAALALGQYFQREGKPFGRLRSIVPATSDKESNAPWLEVGDGMHRHRVSAAALRREVFPARLHSPRFTVRLTSDTLDFNGRGSGHGVGLCQWGARGQALEQRTAIEIVEHYYPGARVTSLAKIRSASAGTSAATR